MNIPLRLLNHILSFTTNFLKWPAIGSFGYSFSVGANAKLISGVDFNSSSVPNQPNTYTFSATVKWAHRCTSFIVASLLLPRLAVE